MKQVSKPILFAMLSGLLLFGCKNTQDNGPVIAPLYTETERQTFQPKTPSSTNQIVSATATPKPSSVSYTVGDFLPAQSIFIGYKSLKRDESYDSYVEYISQDTSQVKVQRRVFSQTGEPQPYVEVFTCSNGELRRDYYADGVGFTYNFLDKTPNDGEVFLKEPIVPGTKWDIEGGKSIITSIDTSLRVPMGSNLATVEVTTDYENGEIRRRYFMAGLGLVAEYYNDADGDLIYSIEANSHEKDKEFKQSIRFFYADQSGSIKYITREVSVSLNQNMTDFFKEKLSVKPTGNSLISYRNAGLSIRSIKLNDKKYVTIDLAAPLSVEQQYEKNCLQALANTLGEYFQCTRVYFTIKQENYESRFLMLLDGEYFEPKIKSSSSY